MSTLVWFRLDLRLDDQPALAAAIERGQPVIPVFIWCPEEEKPWASGSATRWWLHHSLTSLNHALERLGSRLIVRAGPSLETLRQLAHETRAESIHWNRRYEPMGIARDCAVKQALASDGFQVESHNSALLFEPWVVKTKSGTPFQVFTPFWKACLAMAEPETPGPPPTAIPAPDAWPESLRIEQLNLLPTIPWDAGMREAWQPGEAGAWTQFGNFVDRAIREYAENRNRPDLPGTSRLSPHLHFGEISVRRVWHELQKLPAGEGKRVFLSEIGWREFAHHLLFHFPHTTDAPLRAEFERFPWQENTRWLRAWQKGRTGYPIVDAGMRELWHTGWMHNRVRMIVASFLVKDLRIPWQDGARWFWDTLVDADLASNTLGWQWTAGCGADAAPYFRVFNPVNQGEKFDPGGAYIRRWVPELSGLPDAWIHQPWEAPPMELMAAGVRMGETYPRPIVNHAEARDQALEAWKAIRRP